MQGSSIHICLVDIASVFDNVIPAILIHDLEDIGVSSDIHKFIQNLISERELCFVNDDKLSDSFWIHKTTPQGSSLSSLLFNIYMNINKYIKTLLCYNADDVVICSSFT